MLDVVENQQHAPVGEVRVQQVAGGPVASLPQPQCLDDRGDDVMRIGDRRQRHEGHAIGKLLAYVGRHLQGEAGLAHPAHPGQRDQPRPVALQQGPHRALVVVASDQRGRRNRKRGQRLALR